MQHRSGPSVHRRSSSQRAPCPTLRVASPRLLSVRVQAGFDPVEFMRSMFDFESWAPKSSRIWRLGHYQHQGSETDADNRTEADDAVDDLQQRIRRTSERDSQAAQRTTRASESSASSSTAPTAPLPEAGGAFSSSDDGDLSSSFAKRVAQLAAAAAASEGVEVEELEEVETLVEEAVEVLVPLLGDELRSLIYAKYKKTLDVSIVRRDIPGKSFVSLNILWNHLEQRSFKMTEDQYMEKLESVAMMINLLNQTDKVRSFLLKPAKSQNGMPARPVVGTAISVRFEGLSKEVVEEWFGAGYF